MTKEQKAELLNRIGDMWVYVGATTDNEMPLEPNYIQAEMLVLRDMVEPMEVTEK